MSTNSSNNTQEASPQRRIEWRAFQEEDIRSIGPNKPMGYLSNDWDPEVTMDLKELQREVEARGVKTIWYDDEARETRSQAALYAYDEDALQQLLNQRRVVLEEAGWPTSPRNFVARVANEFAPRKTALFDVVADAFADKDDPRRTDVSD